MTGQVQAIALTEAVMDALLYRQADELGQELNYRSEPHLTETVKYGT